MHLYNNLCLARVYTNFLVEDGLGQPWGRLGKPGEAPQGEAERRRAKLNAAGRGGTTQGEAERRRARRNDAGRGGTSQGETR